MKKVILVVMVLVALVGGAGYFAYLFESTSSEAPVVSKDRDLVLVANGSPASLDPLRLIDVTTGLYVSAVHAPLTIVGKDGELVYILAEDMEMSEDALSCTITLREASFGDSEGSPVTARDVVFSFRRLVDHPQSSLIFGRVKEGEDGYVVKDRHTLVVSFREPEPDFPLLVSSSICSIVKSFPEDTPAQEFDRHIIGAGPYILDTAQPGDKFSFRRNPGFPLSVDFPGLQIRVIEYEQGQLASLADRSADMVQVRGPILNEIVEQASGGKLALRSRFEGLRIHTRPSNELVVLVLKSGDTSELSDAQRQSLYHALYNSMDREALAQDVYLDTAAAAYGVVPPDFGGITEAISSTQSSEVDLPEVTFLAANDADSRRLAEIVRAAAQGVGVSMRPTFLDLSTLANRLISGENVDVGLVWFEMNVSATGPLPWGMFFVPGSAFTVLGEPIEGLGKTLDAALGKLNPIERAAAYEAAFDEVSEKQRTWVPILSRHATWLTSHRVSEDFLDHNGKLHLCLVQRADQ